MSYHIKTAQIEWQNNKQPVSARFDDPYYSIQDGLEESRYVFLTGNGLPDRFADGFHIAELGFGTGLNLLAAWQSWNASGQKGRLNYTSFEAYPMTITDMRIALSNWPELKPLADLMLTQMELGTFKIETPTLTARIILGDARTTLPKWQYKADAWFLDGFSPVKNPELWGKDILQSVANHTVSGGTCATYTAAGHVRQSLASAGFTVTRVTGFGRKRHMTIGIL